METPHSVFDPPDLCYPFYISEDFVFVGRVISTDNSVKFSKNYPQGLAKMRIAVEEPIKGDLGQYVNVYRNLSCYEYINVDDIRIFTAKKMSKPDIKGLVSNFWSKSLDSISKQELAKISNKVRSITKGEKQPRISGNIIKYTSNEFISATVNLIYPNANIQEHPHNPMPLEGIELTAKLLNTKESSEKKNILNESQEVIYTTKTLTDGSYEFVDLPPGFYELSENIPEKLFVEAFRFKSEVYEKLHRSSFKMVEKNKAIIVNVGNDICGEVIRFNVRESAQIKGELFFESGLPLQTPEFSLYFDASKTVKPNYVWIDVPSFEINKSKINPKNILDFSLSDLSAGKYILKIIFDPKDESKNFYYPKVQNIENAEVIEVKEGETKNISLKF